MSVVLLQTFLSKALLCSIEYRRLLNWLRPLLDLLIWLFVNCILASIWICILPLLIDRCSHTTLLVWVDYWRLGIGGLWMLVVRGWELRCDQVVIIVRVVYTERLGLLALLMHPLWVDLFRVNLELICLHCGCNHAFLFWFCLLLDWKHFFYEELLEVVFVRFLGRRFTFVFKVLNFLLRVNNHQILLSRV